jgi:outer membrane receptor protein involved in Fe transport
MTIVGTNFTAGNTSNATQGRDLRRFTIVNNMTWQKGTHRLRFGTEIERAPGTGFWGFCDPACVSLYSPEIVYGLFNPALPPGAPPLRVPTQVRSNEDLLALPFAGAVIGIGDPSQPPPYQVDLAKNNSRYRFFAQDSWRLRPNFTLNYGLAWNFESTLVNRDLPKPQYLAPLYGSDLSPTNNNYNNFSPSLGFAWNPGQDNKTVIRGGGGIYYETEPISDRWATDASSSTPRVFPIPSPDWCMPRLERHSCSIGRRPTLRSGISCKRCASPCQRSRRS